MSIGHHHRTPRRLLVSVVALACALLLALPAAAQTAPRIQIRDVQADADGNVTVIAAVSPDVTEEEVLAGLIVRENNVRIEDAQAQFVARTETVAVDAEVALLVDTSGSTADDGALDLAVAAARDFVTELTQQGVRVTLITFASTAEVVVNRGQQAAPLLAALDGLAPGGETAMYDAVDVALGVLEGVPAEQREIVLFTDGGDTASTGGQPPVEGTEADPGALLSAVSQRAAVAGIPITAVSLQTTETDTAALSDLAAAAGGLVLAVDDADQLDTTLGQVARSISSQLQIQWTTPDPTAGTFVVTLALQTDRGLTTSAPRSAVNPNASIPGSPIGEQPPPLEVRPPGSLLGATLGRLLGLGTAGIAVLLLGSVVLTAPADRRSAKLLQRQLEGSSKRRPDRDARPDVDVRERVSSLLESVPKPSGFDERIQSQLARADWPLRTGEFIGMRLGLLLAGLTLGWALTVTTSGGSSGPAQIVLPLLLGGLGWMVPRIILERRRAARTEAFHQQMADTMQMLAGSLRAGYGLMQGIDNVATEGQAPTATEFGRVLTEVRLGIPIEDALAAMADRVDSEDFRWVTVAINIQRKVGGNLAELLDTVATTLREREQVRRQVQVLSAEGRLSAWVLIALPIAFALYLTVTQPSYLAPLFSSFMGWMMILGGAVLMSIGVVWIRSVVRIDV